MSKRPPEVEEYIRRIASMGGQARMQSLTQEQREELARKGGLAGGRSRAKKLSAKRRKEIARKAAQARWGKKSGNRSSS